MDLPNGNGNNVYKSQQNPVLNSQGMPSSDTSLPSLDGQYGKTVPPYMMGPPRGSYQQTMNFAPPRVSSNMVAHPPSSLTSIASQNGFPTNNNNVGQMGRSKCVKIPEATNPLIVPHGQTQLIHGRSNSKEYSNIAPGYTQDGKYFSPEQVEQWEKALKVQQLQEQAEQEVEERTVSPSSRGIVLPSDPFPFEESERTTSNHSCSGRTPSVHSGSERVLSNHSSGGRVLSNHSGSGRVLSNHSDGGRVLSNHSGSGRVLSNHSDSGRVLSNHSASGRVLSNHSGSGRTPSVHSGSGRTTSNHSGSGTVHPPEPFLYEESGRTASNHSGSSKNHPSTPPPGYKDAVQMRDVTVQIGHEPPVTVHQYMPIIDEPPVNPVGPVSPTIPTWPRTQDSEECIPPPEPIVEVNTPLLQQPPPLPVEHLPQPFQNPVPPFDKGNNPLHLWGAMQPAYVQDLVSCTECGGYLHEPRALPCFHFFCTNCLAKKFKTAKVNQHFACPDCNKTFLVEKKKEEVYFKADFLQKILDNAVKYMNHPPCKCQLNNRLPLTDHPVASRYCRECNISICVNCSAEHEHDTDLRLDFVEEFIENSTPKVPLFCDLHPHTVYEFYCTHSECQKPVCRKCVKELHQEAGHKYINLNMMALYFRKQLTLYETTFLRKGMRQVENRERFVKKYERNLLMRFDTVNRLATKRRNRSHRIVENCKHILLSELKEITDKLIGDGIYEMSQLRNLKVDIDDTFGKLQAVASLSYNQELTVIYNAAEYATLLYVTWTTLYPLNTQGPLVYGLKLPRYNLGMQIGRSKLIKKIQLMPHSVDCIAVNRKLMVAIHRRSTGTGLQPGDAVIMCDGEDLNNFWQKLIGTNAPRPYAISFVRYGGDEYLAIVNRHKQVYMDAETEPPAVDFCNGKDLTAKDEIELYSGENYIKLLNVYKPVIMIHARDNFSPLCVARKPHKDGFYFTNVELATDPASIQCRGIQDTPQIVYQPPSHQNELYYPEQLLINSKNEFVILDLSTRKILIISEEGKIIETIIPPNVPQAANIPTCICLDMFDNIYVAYKSANRIDLLNPKGEFICTTINETDGLVAPKCMMTYQDQLIVGNMFGEILFFHVTDRHTMWSYDAAEKLLESMIEWQAYNPAHSIYSIPKVRHEMSLPKKPLDWYND